MKIGIIGAGNVGTGIAKLLKASGHQVMLSFARDQAKLQRLATEFGMPTGSVAEAVNFGEVLALATPFTATPEALQQAGPTARDASTKILWDCTNALNADMSGLAIGTTTSAAEEVQRLAPWARVVKGIPPFAEVLHSGDLKVDGEAVGVFVCGDDLAAKEKVVGLVKDMGAAVVDAGPLVNARWVEPAAMLLVRLAYGMGMGSRIGLKLLAQQHY